MNSQREVYEQAYRAWDAQDYASAGPLLVQAAGDAEGDDACSLWFDAALAYKFLRDWPRAFELGRTAAALAERGVQDPAFWNLGIAATVLSEWDVARDAWRGYGIVLESTAGEVREDFGMTPIRLDPDGRPEVVWAQRICPARAIIRSVPLRADRSFGDVILHDGAPNGRRIVGERKYPVFDELLVWQASGMQTWSVMVDADEAGVRELEEIFARHELGAEPAEGVELICACCSTGEVEQHDPAAHSGHSAHSAHSANGRVFHLAAPEETVFSLLHVWQSTDKAARAYRDVTLLP